MENGLTVKFIHSEMATKFCEISILLLDGTTQDKSKVEILQNFVAFPEYMNFTKMGSENTPNAPKAPKNVVLNWSAQVQNFGILD